MPSARRFLVRKVLIFLGLLSFSASCTEQAVAQDKQSQDSIWSVILKAPNDTASVIAYLYYGELFLPAHTDSALHYYGKAASIARKYHSDKHYMNYLQFQGDYHVLKSDLV